MTENHEAEFKKFRDLVRQMRRAQEIYFKTGGGLSECRKIEREVDRALAEETDRQQGLFT